MLALIPILAGLIPDVVKWIAGDHAGTVATAVTDTVGKVVGSVDPTVVTQFIADPQKAAELQLALAKIGADREAGQRADDLATLQATLSDNASARNREIQLRDWMPGILAVGTTLGFFGLLSVFAFVIIPVANASVLNILIGSLASGFGCVLQYYFGSSVGQQRSTELLHNSIPVDSVDSKKK